MFWDAMVMVGAAMVLLPITAVPVVTRLMLEEGVGMTVVLKG